MGRLIVVSNFEQQLASFGTLLLASPKEKLVGLSTTANKNNPPYFFSSPRETESTFSINIIFREEDKIKGVIEYFDGKVDYFLLDCESKNEVTDLVGLALLHIKKSKYHLVKPNQYAIMAADEFVATYFEKKTQLKVGIIGAGNLGSQIALHLAQRGYTVSIFGNDPIKTRKIVEGLNLVYRGVNKINVATTSEEAAESSNCLIGATNGVAVITDSMVRLLAKDSFVLDAGNGTFTADAVAQADKLGIPIYCLSAKAGYDAFISNWLATRGLLAQMGKKTISQELSLVTLGLVGKKGDLLVRSLKSPVSIIGVCDGRGDLMLPDEANLYLERYHELNQG